VNAAARPTLAVQRRQETGKKNAVLRRAGRLPGVVFGHSIESSNVSIDAHEFDLFRKHASKNTLLDLVVDGGKPTPVLIYNVQIHPTSRRPLHVDLMAVRMTEELTVDVPIVATGTSILLEREGGTLSHAIDSVRVRALPDHLPQSIEVSIEGLTSFDHVIHVRDLQIPSDAHLLTDPDEVAIRILPPRVELEAPTAAEEEAAAAAEGAEGAGESASEGESAG
jgi:large subunit ribosomal protein L25